jgi:hypothetical protein
MDRAPNIFTRWTRIITVAISICFVIALHIDAGSILSQITTSSDIRAGLSRISDKALSQADEVVREGNRGSTALKKFVEDHKVAISATTLNTAPALVTCAEAVVWLGQNSPKEADASKLQMDFANECRNICQQTGG